MKFPNLPGKKVFRVLGITGLLLCVYFLTMGVLLIMNNPEQGIDEYYDTWDFRAEKDSCAIVMPPESIMEISKRDRGGYNNIKVKVSGNNHSGRLFIGTAGQTDIDTWLDGVEYDEITDMDIFPCRADYLNHPGSGLPGIPAEQDFWIEKSYGSGIRALGWEAVSGGSSLVFMNEGGFAGIDIDITLGTNTPLIMMGAISHISIGVVILAISIYLLSFSAKTSNVAYPQPLAQSLKK